MSRLTAIPVLVSIGVACLSGASDGSITYNVEPSLLSDGYMLEGGHITTNGTLGHLNPADILDYEVRVVGPTPYVFTPSSPSSSILMMIGTVSATSTVMMFPEIDEPPSAGGLAFVAEDNTGPGCSDCKQFLLWSSMWFPLGPKESVIRYHFSDRTDSIPFVDARHDFPDQTYLLVATVPEPSTIMLSLLATCVGFLGSRRKRLA
jgi:hypothetical protein